MVNPQRKRKRTQKKKKVMYRKGPFRKGQGVGFFWSLT
jgi:hypothetical protein